MLPALDLRIDGPAVTVPAFQLADGLQYSFAHVGQLTGQCVFPAGILGGYLFVCVCVFVHRMMWKGRGGGTPCACMCGHVYVCVYVH